jgi:restriction system protein
MARYPSEWILLTNPHITDTHAAPEGMEFLIAPEDNLRAADIVYLWANPFNFFYAWGEVASTPRPEVFEVPSPGGYLEKTTRIAVPVRDIKHFHPQITEEMMLRRTELRKLIPKGQADDLCAIPLRPGQAAQINDFVREFNLDAPQQSATVRWSVLEYAPDITVQSIITFKDEIITLGSKTGEGRIVELVRPAWDTMIKIIERDPNEIMKIDPRKFEELIAAAYERTGLFDIVELTPHSNDKGRDVVATRNGMYSIRIFDQVKRYRINRPVTYEEVMAFFGVISSAPNVSKGVITTTSSFAPTLMDNEDVRRLVPHKVELKPRDILLPWLYGLRR